jgi:hypothetical protein
MCFKVKTSRFSSCCSYCCSTSSSSFLVVVFFFFFFTSFVLLLVLLLTFPLSRSGEDRSKTLQGLLERRTTRIHFEETRGPCQFSKNLSWKKTRTTRFFSSRTSCNPQHPPEREILLSSSFSLSLSHYFFLGVLGLFPRFESSLCGF